MSEKDNLIYKAHELELGSFAHLRNFSSRELINLLQCELAPKDALVQLPVWLAKNVKHLKTKVFEKLLDNTDYVAEIKLDGCRAKMHLGKTGIRVDSRNFNKVNYHYDEKTANFPFLQNLKIEFPNTILDAEFMAPIALAKKYGSWVTAASAMFNSDPPHSLELQKKYGAPTWYIHDILVLDGHDIRQLTWQERRSKLEPVLNWLTFDKPKAISEELELRVVDTSFTHYRDGNYGNVFNQYLRTWRSIGVEGLMLKQMDSRYNCTHGSRTQTMYKWKAQNEQDCFIIGFIPGQGQFDGMIGSLKLGCYDHNGAIIEVGAVQPGNMYMRGQLSYHDGSLKEEYYNSVIEIEYQEMTCNDLMRHATLLRWRPDKEANECILI